MGKYLFFLSFFCLIFPLYGELMTITTSNGIYTFDTGEIENIVFSPGTWVENMAKVIDKIPVNKVSNFPNPFNPKTTIRFSLQESGKTTVSVYNSRGQLVKTLLDKEMEKGNKKIVWDGKNSGGKVVASGVYFYRISLNGKQVSNKMILIK